jgi:hypothetical protein
MLKCGEELVSGKVANFLRDYLPPGTKTSKYLISSHLSVPNLLLMSFSRAELTNPYCRVQKGALRLLTPPLIHQSTSTNTSNC